MINSRYGNVLARLSLIIAVSAMLAGCTTAGRVPFTSTEQAEAGIAGIPGARIWADDSGAFLGAMQRERASGGLDATNFKMLALSGGGAEGAYGAGFLGCWTKSGMRPTFSIVTGASVGALIAPFAFLGPAYDGVLKRMFTSGDTEGLLQFAGLNGLFGSGLFREEPLAKLVDTYVTPQLLVAIAAEHAAGRRLFVVTTNLDSQRTAVWDMGTIASSSDPQALALFKSVLLASTSIPGIFPPELIEVQANGRVFKEMHVDGSVTANILVVPEAILTSRMAIGDIDPEIYVVVNGKVGPDFKLVDPGLLPIFQRSFETTIKSNTRNALIASTDFVRQRGWTLRVAAIPDAAPGLGSTDFDTRKMTSLYDFGCATALSDARWSTR
ncbi:patatin-like phospholipase family protein [uncultured Devosia sp.]|uniref:patatin-like phospholipase family protein n=1 Tax=uncultured Devosia sp. TaxID=211434 RepID=UPI0035CC1993